MNELDVNPVQVTNPLFDDPMASDPNVPEAQEPPMMLASALGPAFRKVIKNSMDEVPQVIEELPTTSMGAEAEMRSAEFAERHGMQQDEMPEKAININLKYLDAPDQVNQVITTIADMMPDKVKAARRDVQSHEQTQKLADEMGMTVEDLLERPLGEAWNAERIYAARTILATSRDTIDKLATKINSEGGGTPEEMVEFRRALGVYAGVQQQIHGLAAEAGRALNQFKIMAQTGELKKREINAMLDTAGTASTERMAAMWTSMDDPAQKAKFAKKAHQVKGIDMVLEYWINALLSAPSTHAVNILGNSLASMWALPERGMAAGISKIRMSLGGKGGVAPSEVTAQAWGMYRGALDGFKLAWQVLKTREPTDPMQKIENREHNAITSENVESLINRGVKVGGKAANWMLRNDIAPEEIELSGWAGRAVDGLGSFIRLPGVALMAEDEFFKSVAYRMELNALAARQAFQEGLSGAEAAERISAILDNPPEQMHIASVDAGHYKTFTEKLGATSSLQRFLTEAPVLRFIMPFVRTPVNLLKYSFERIPGLNMLVKRSRDELMSSDPATRDIAMGKLAMGSLMMTAAMPLVSEHFENVEGDYELTGAAPSDPALKAQWRRNHQEYSLRVGDEWYAYNRLDPLGQMLGIMADSVRIMRGADEATLEEYSTAIVHAISNNVVNKTYMSGIADFFEVFTSFDENKWKKFTKRYAASFMPNIMRRAETQIDPTVRLTDDIMQEYCARVPGCSSDMPPMRNLWGAPIESRALGPEFISPIFNMQQKYSMIDKELDRLQYPIRMPMRVMRGTELDHQQYSDYVELQGRKVVMAKGIQLPMPDGSMVSISNLNMKDALSKVVKSKSYKAMSDSIDPPGGKVKMIRAIVDMYRNEAQFHLMRKYPELVGSMETRKQLEAEAGGMSPLDAARLGKEYSTTVRQAISTNLNSRVVE